MRTVVLGCSSALVLRCLGAACLVLSAGVLRAHMATEDASAGLIAGQVMDATTGQPVLGAAVRWEGGPLIEAEITANGTVTATRTRHVIVDSQGRFAIPGLTASAFTLSITAPTGYEEAFASVKLEPDQRVTDVLIRMKRRATVSGTIRDEAGDPVVGAPVRAYLKMTFLASGTLQLKGERAITDDRGGFRIVDLPQGNYLICVCDNYSPPIVPSLLQLLGAGRSSLHSPTRFVRTFYPASPTTTNASTVRLGAGDDRTGIDIELRTTSSVRVSGHLQGVSMDAATAMTVMLVPEGDLVALGATNLTPTSVTTDGKFEFTEVPPGTYVFEAFSKNPMKGPWASVPIAVGPEDVDDLAAALRFGPSFSGQLDFRGNGLKPGTFVEHARIALIPIDPTPRLRLSDGTAMLISQTSAVDREGRFRVENLSPGRYAVSVPNLPGWREADTIITVGNQDIGGAVITMIDETLQLIEADVELDRYESPKSIVLRAFPADAALWAETFRDPKRFLSVSSSTSTFRFAGVPAGDYFVARQVPGLDASQESLELLARTATRVTVRPNEVTKVSIRR